MAKHFADRLAEAVKKKRNSLCVGLDPQWPRLPLSVRQRYGNQSLQAVADAYEEFCNRIVDIVAPTVAVVKPQSAFFESCGPAGMTAMQRVMRRARRLGLFVILDAKRNDIASTASAYATAAFGGTTVDDRCFPVWEADALTINPYLGRDAVEPFLAAARAQNGGVFVLVRTSNAGAGQFQDLVCDGQSVYQHVANAVGLWNDENLGDCGLGDVGAVVGATHPDELRQVRESLPNVWFLIPGFGAQGGKAADVASGFRDDGLGAIVNSSRGVIACFDPSEDNWESNVEAATANAVTQLARHTPMGKLK